MMNKLKTYDELIKFDTFEDRYNYLKLDGVPFKETFGYDRYLNQLLYESEEWRRVRTIVIVRDNGCDLGINDRPILDKYIIVHHMNPITKEDIINRNDIVFNPKYLISSSFSTHRNIHYPDENYISQQKPIERYPGDTCPWKIKGGNLNE